MEPLGRMTLTFRIFRTIYNITQSYLTEGEGTVNAKLIKTYLLSFTPTLTSPNNYH